jgi:DNA-binding phage protein
MLKKLALMLLVSVFAIACGDNLMDPIADDDSSAAQSVELEKALNEKNYDYIIGELGKLCVDEDIVIDPKFPEALEKCITYPDYSDLSAREKYLLLLAYLGQTEFDALANLEQFFEDDDDISATDVLSGLQTDSDNLTLGRIADKVPRYERILWVADKYGEGDPDIETVAGIAAAMKLLISVSDVTLKVSEILDIKIPGTDLDLTKVSFNEDDDNYVVKVFENFDTDNLPAKDQVIASLKGMETTLNTDIDYVVKAAETLGGGAVSEEDMTEVKENLDEYIAEMKGCPPETPDCGNLITAESIYDFILSKI